MLLIILDTDEQWECFSGSYQRDRTWRSPRKNEHEHLHLRLRHLVRYYRTTSDLELRIQPKTRIRVPEGEPELLSVEAYSDSDWAGCRDTRRSTSGGMIYFEGAVLSFWSRTQTTIVLSSCEAELYAINMATIEALNVKSTIEELIPIP